MLTQPFGGKVLLLVMSNILKFYPEYANTAIWGRVLLLMSNMLMFYPEYTNTAIWGRVLLLVMSNMLMFYPEYTNTAIWGGKYFSWYVRHTDILPRIY